MNKYIKWILILAGIALIFYIVNSIIQAIKDAEKAAKSVADSAIDIVSAPFRDAGKALDWVGSLFTGTPDNKNPNAAYVFPDGSTMLNLNGTPVSNGQVDAIAGTNIFGVPTVSSTLNPDGSFSIYRGNDTP